MRARLTEAQSHAQALRLAVKPEMDRLKHALDVKGRRQEKVRNTALAVAILAEGFPELKLTRHVRRLRALAEATRTPDSGSARALSPSPTGTKDLP